MEAEVIQMKEKRLKQSKKLMSEEKADIRHGQKKGRQPQPVGEKKKK